MDISIFDDGDVILALAQQVYLRVSSSVLIHASPVFKAMLRPNFKEGQDHRSASNPKEIAMPYDSASAMKDMCYLLHAQNVHDGESLDTPYAIRLSLLALVADKHHCVRAVSLPVEALLLRFLDRGTHNPLAIGAVAHLAAVACVLARP